jgi:hypothetical protein
MGGRKTKLSNGNKEKMKLLKSIDEIITSVKRLGSIPIALWAQDKARKKFSPLRWIIVIAAFLVVTFIFFYNISHGIRPELKDIEIFNLAIDIALAHTVVTLPIITISISVFLGVALGLIVLAETLTDITDKVASAKASSEPIFDLALSVLLFFVLVKFVQLDRFLLAGSPHLQTFVFGKFDPSLGFQYPTTFRATILIDNINLFVNNMIANPTPAIILGLLAMIPIVVMAIMGFFKAIAFLSKRLKSQ